MKRWREVLHQVKFEPAPSQGGIFAVNEGPDMTLGKVFLLPDVDLCCRETELDRRALIDELWRREDAEKAKAKSNATWDALKGVCGR